MKESNRTKKHTLKKRCKPDHEAIFLRESFFYPPKKKFSSPLFFNFFPNHTTTILQTCHDTAMNANRFGQMSAKLQLNIYGRTAGQHITAPTQKAGFRASQTHLCKPKVQFSE